MKIAQRAQNICRVVDCISNIKTIQNSELFLMIICPVNEYLLLERDVVVDELFGQDHAVLEVDVPVGHPVGEKQLFAEHVLGLVEQAGLVVTVEVVLGGGEAQITLRIRSF